MKKNLLHVSAGQGTTWSIIGGDVITCKATGADTGGDCAIFETTTPPGCGSPPHVHHREDELFYVLEGEFEFFVGPQTIRAGRGAFLIAPRDIPHRFANIGTGVGKLLITVTPPGIEKFFDELSRLPVNIPPTPEQMAAFAKTYGIEFLTRVS